jgi:hypothetical protein
MDWKQGGKQMRRYAMFQGRINSKKRLRNLSPKIAMMNAGDSWHGNNRSFPRRPFLDRSRAWRILFEGIMSSVVVIVSDVITKEPEQMTRAQGNDMVEELPSATADPSLGDTGLPGTPVCSAYRLDTEGSDGPEKLLAEDGIPVEDQILR